MFIFELQRLVLFVGKGFIGPLCLMSDFIFGSKGEGGFCCSGFSSSGIQQLV